MIQARDNSYDAVRQLGPWAAVWPPVAARLKARLLLRACPLHVADDIVQDVALKLLEAPQRFETLTDLYRWAMRVATNRHIDHYRASRRMATEPVPEGAARGDIFEEVVARLERERLMTALAKMDPGERSSLLHVTPDHASRQERNRLNVRRFRARAHLAHLLDVDGLAPQALMRPA